MKCKHCQHEADDPAGITYSVAVDHPGRPVATPCAISGCHYRELESLAADVIWRHDWHERLGRGEAETEGAFYTRIEARV